ncbi:MAG: Ig-like domain-containing protein [Streptosporangiaceae bacterium]
MPASKGGRATSRRGGRKATRAALPALLILALAVSACQGGPANVFKAKEPPKKPAKVTIAPDDHTKGFRPDHEVRVSVAHGTIKHVRVDPVGKDTDERGAVAGSYASRRTAWRSDAPLVPDTRYKIKVVALGENGKKATEHSSFRTLKPDETLGTSIAPLDGEQVGVGMPIVVIFTEDVADKAKVERHLKLRMSEDVPGAWHWIDDDEVHFRPRHYWPAGEHVALHVNLTGVKGGKGLWGDHDRRVSFDVGDRHMTVVNTDTHTMRVKKNGHVVRNVPVSTGRPEYATYSGTYVAVQKAYKTVMTSDSVGISPDAPGGYRETVYWNVRISWSGEFVHSAPWSVGSQGSANVSHGCVNASPANAEWFYHFTQRGDVIKVVGSPKELQWQNGWTDWMMGWHEWVKGSALDRVVNAPSPAPTATATGTATVTPTSAASSSATSASSAS